MKQKSDKSRIKSGITSLLLASLCGLASAANIVEVPKVMPGNTATAGPGKEWPTTRFVADPTGNCATDKLTGLMWPYNSTLLGSGTWGSSGTSGTVQNMVAQMNTNSSATGYKLCGYSDWRVPNINELLSMVTYSTTQTPKVWLATKGFNVIEGYYWTANAYDSDEAYLVFFGGFGTNIQGIQYGYSVWPVRGGK